MSERELPMFYHICGYAPAPGMGESGFSIKLFPAWKAAVETYKPAIDQESANRVVELMGRHWLDGHGYNAIYDPDNSGFGMDKNKPPGPNAMPMYQPRTSIQVSWGEWGPQHITVPGNACGLDIDDGLGKPRDGKVLLPHNVDSVRQASLLLTVFLFFAETFVINAEAELHR